MDLVLRIGAGALAVAGMVLVVGGVSTQSAPVLVLGVLVVAGAATLFLAPSRRTPSRTAPGNAAGPRSAVPASYSSTATVIVPPATTPVIEAARLRDTPPGELALDEPTTSRSVSPMQPHRADTLMPRGVEPADVVAALFTNAEAAGDPIAAHLWLEDPTSDTLRLVSVTGTARPDGTPEPLRGTILGQALDENRALLLPLWRTADRDGERLVWRFALPLAAGQARGVAALDFVGSESPDGAALTNIAAALRGALSGALALHVARTETAAARTVMATATDLSRIIDPHSVLHTALKRSMELASAETGSIMLVDQTTGLMTIEVSVGLSQEVVATTRVAEGEGIAGWVLASRKPLVVEDLNGRGPRSRRHGVRSAVSVPMADADGVIGVMNVGSRTFSARFSQSHLDALEALARSTTVAYRNALAVETAQDLYFDTLKALAIALETKDPYSMGATARVVDQAMALGAAMGLTDDEMVALRIASMLHDVGMSAAGDVVTVSNRPLSTVEWGMLKMHPVIASDVLAQAPALREAIPIVYHHHEHYDGSGYVVGLSGEHIPLGARILAVADAYVAMTSDRPYRPAMTHEQALAELKERSGSQFDPEVVRAFDELSSSPNRDKTPRD